MKQSAQKLKATTQRFTEIADVYENMVLLTSGNALLIIEVIATNFALQSSEEQQVKILSYASLLNSLSFAIQIFITSKQLDISSYLKLLDSQIKQAPNPLLSSQMSLYRDFVAELVKVNTVLDKKFYIVIPYSPLEKGVTGAKDVTRGANQDPASLNQAKLTLRSKAESILNQVLRLNLKARILEKEDLIRLFYEIYNGPIPADAALSETFKAPIVEGKKQ